MAGLDPETWRSLLSSELAMRQQRLELYTAYYDGNHRLQFATTKFKEAFADQLSAFSSNWCGLVVDSAADRLNVEGIAFEDRDASSLAWKVWQENRLDARSVMAHTEAIKCETSYVIVSPPAEGELMPRLTVEHPSQVIVAHDPADRRNRIAAYKRYWGWGIGLVEVLYLPDTITVWNTGQMSAPGRTGVVEVFLPRGVARPERVTTVPNPLGVVPVVPLENNPSILHGGVSDLRPAIALNDAINKFFLDMLVGSEYNAFPQRVIMGVEIPDDDDTAELRSSQARTWFLEEPNAKIAEFTAAQLSNYTDAIEVAVQHLAAQTRTPPHYLLAKMMNLSGDALRAAEAGLVHRVKRKTVNFGDGWEDATRVAFRWRALRAREQGLDQDADQLEVWAKDVASETEWGAVEELVPSVVADSLVKKSSIGWPREMLWREGGMSVQEVEMAKTLADQAGSVMTIQDVQVRRAAGIPFEYIWKEMGYSDDEQKEIARLSPLPRAGDPALGGSPTSSGGGASPQGTGSQPGPGAKFGELGAIPENSSEQRKAM